MEMITAVGLCPDPFEVVVEPPVAFAPDVDLVELVDWVLEAAEGVTTVRLLEALPSPRPSNWPLLPWVVGVAVAELELGVTRSQV